MDIKIFRVLNLISGRYAPVDNLMVFFSNKIRYVYLVVLIMLWFRNRANKRIVIEAGCSLSIALILQWLIKLIYFKPRPFMKRHVDILIPSKMDSTFPSKHTVLTFAVSTSIFLYHRTLGYFMLGMSAMTGFSRIWTGIHYPSDIIGSAFLGSVTSLLTRVFSHNFTRQ